MVLDDDRHCSERLTFWGSRNIRLKRAWRSFLKGALEYLRSQLGKHLQRRRAGLCGHDWSAMANLLASCVSSLKSTNTLLSSSISILDSGVSDFPRLAKVLQTTRVRPLPSHASSDFFSTSPNCYLNCLRACINSGILS